MKIVFFGSNNFVIPVLDQLLIHHDVAGVVTMPDAPMGRKQILTPTPISVHAENANLTVFKPGGLKNDQILHELKNIGADVYIVASYGKIIPPQILSLPPKGVLNIHPSLLPQYRGPTPIQTALLNGDVKTGVSIIRMDDQIDHGPIVAQKTVTIQPEQNFAFLAKELFSLGATLLHESLNQYAYGTVVPTVQDDTKATFTKMLTKQDGKINWQLPAQHIYNQHRAYHLWPGIWTQWNTQHLKILDCSITDIQDSQRPGTVLPKGIIACKDGTGLQIKKLQLPGKQATDIQSFLRGHPQFIDSVLA